MNRAAAILSLTAVAISYAVGFTTRTAESSVAMQPFVLIIRQRPTQLSDADLERRADDIQTWAQEQNAQGRKLDPRTLGPETYATGPEGNDVSTKAADAEQVSALLFLEARDLADAVSVARSHPGLKYGAVSIEVRPWSSPVRVGTSSARSGL
jgi:hypothetical protein